MFSKYLQNLPYRQGSFRKVMLARTAEVWTQVSVLAVHRKSFSRRGERGCVVWFHHRPHCGRCQCDTPLVPTCEPLEVRLRAPRHSNTQTAETSTGALAPVTSCVTVYRECLRYVGKCITPASTLLLHDLPHSENLREECDRFADRKKYETKPSSCL